MLLATGAALAVLGGSGKASKPPRASRQPIRPIEETKSSVRPPASARKPRAPTSSRVLAHRAHARLIGAGGVNFFQDLAYGTGRAVALG